MEEKAAKPADGARWGESTVALTLEETSPGVELGSGISLLTTQAVMYPIGNDVTVVAAGRYVDFWMPHAGTITKWRMVGNDKTGSAVLDYQKATYANYPTFASITASDKPTISGAQKAEGTALTGWTTSFAAGDCFRIVVDSVATFTLISAGFEYTRVL